jgi:hypothetical protein
MAAEFAPYGIRVNAYQPAITDTPMVHHILVERAEQKLTQIPLRRFGQPSQIANLVWFLTSEQADYITGQIIPCDGGIWAVQRPMQAYVKAGVEYGPAVSNIRAVALDIDGTLAGADHRVSARSAKILETLQERGILPILVTGRTEAEALRISAASRLTAPVISCNGAVVTDPVSGERLMVSTVDVETVNRVLEFAAEHRLQPTLWSAAKMFAAEPTEATSVMEAINQEPVVIAPLDTVDRSEIVKVALLGKREQLDAVQDQLAACLPQVKRSMDFSYEASNAGATKWEALRRVLERLGVAPGECMGIGDGDTDVGWLSEIGLPVAVENASPSVRAIASLYIGHHADDAVARFLETYFKCSSME